MSDWIRVRHDITSWKWWRKPEMLSLLIYLIATAQQKGVRRKHRIIKRGQLITTREEIQKNVPNITPQKVRSCLERLVKEGEITLETAKNYTIITICKYEQYCPEEEEKEKVEQNEEEKTLIKKSEQIKQETLKRKQKFYDSLIPYLDRYSKGMLRSFFDYWSEMNKSGSKMRFEMQPTWDLSRRLGTWDRNETKYNEDGKQERQRKSADKLQAILESNKS